MRFSESLEVLEDIGLVEWASKDIREATRIYVNAVAENYFDDLTPLDFRPFIESEYVFDYFVEYDWELDWFSLLSGEFLQVVDREINSLALSANEVDPLMSVDDFESYILGWVSEWTSNARNRFAASLGLDA